MKKNHKNLNAASGFTLVELLVVITIIAVLAAVAFSVGPRMKKRGLLTKNLQTMRQVGILMANYSAENAGAIPPLRQDIQNADGSWKQGSGLDWPWLIMAQLHPGVAEDEMKKVAWWKANRPMMYNSLIVNNLESGKFQAPKSGFGMNSAISGEIYNWEGGRVAGANGYQTRPVPLSKIARPSRTPLLTSAPDYHYIASTFTASNCKPLIIDGKVPMHFVDGHAELIAVSSYNKDNFDYTGKK